MDLSPIQLSPESQRTIKSIRDRFLKNMNAKISQHVDIIVGQTGKSRTVQQAGKIVPVKWKLTEDMTGIESIIEKIEEEDSPA